MTEATDNRREGTSTDQPDEAYAFEAAASFAQQRLWFLDQLEPGSPVYNINFALDLAGPLDKSALQTALQALIDRHESLRTSFERSGSEPVQIISESVSVDLDVIDARQMTENEIDEMLCALAKAAFDLADAPLLRVHLLERGQDDYILLFVIHHIIADAWSLDIFYRELVVCYSAAIAAQPATLPELPIQYADYAEWQQEWLSGAELEKQLEYWRDQLAVGTRTAGVAAGSSASAGSDAQWCNARAHDRTAARTGTQATRSGILVHTLHTLSGGVSVAACKICRHERSGRRHANRGA